MRARQRDARRAAGRVRPLPCRGGQRGGAGRRSRLGRRERGGASRGLSQRLLHAPAGRGGPRLPRAARDPGEATFGRFTAGYLRDRPSARPSLRWLGEGLRNGCARAASRALADLAELEWATLRAFDAEDAAPLTAEAFAAIPP